MSLLCSKIILDRQDYLTYGTDDRSGWGVYVTLDGGRHDDMGRPEQITVCIRPGACIDRLCAAEDSEPHQQADHHQDTNQGP